jgi:hypothetical protein
MVPTDSPRQESTTKVTPRGVQTRKHASTKEGGSELYPPAVVLKSDDGSEADAVKGPTDVPIEGDTGSVQAENFPEEGSNQGNDEADGLFTGSDGPVSAIV